MINKEKIESLPKEVRERLERELLLALDPERQRSLTWDDVVDIQEEVIDGVVFHKLLIEVEDQSEMIDENEWPSIEDRLTSPDISEVDRIELTYAGHFCVLDGEDVKTLFRLARLGMWAEKHAVPTLRSYHAENQVFGGYTKAGQSLAALPKE